MYLKVLSLCMTLTLILTESLDNKGQGRYKRADDVNPLTAIVDDLSQKMTNVLAKNAELESRLSKLNISFSFLDPLSYKYGENIRFSLCVCLCVSVCLSSDSSPIIDLRYYSGPIKLIFNGEVENIHISITPKNSL